MSMESSDPKDIVAGANSLWNLYNAQFWEVTQCQWQKRLDPTYDTYVSGTGTYNYVGRLPFTDVGQQMAAFALGLLHQVHGRFGEALDQLEAALAVARDLGNAQLECIVLCNLGMVYDSLARFDEAQDHSAVALKAIEEGVSKASPSASARPVRPIDTWMSSSVVWASSGGYL